MKYLLLILLAANSYAGTQLATDWVSESTTLDPTAEVSESFSSILDAQARALDTMESKSSMNKALPFGFQMKEMVTDIGVSKSGLMGIAAMSANAGVELKWKKVAAQNLIETEEEVADIVVDENISEADLDGMADDIVNVVRASGKVNNNNLKAKVLEALETVHAQVKEVGVTSYEAWRARHLRLDLNFSATGSIWFVAKAGVAVRLRMEWKLKDLPLTNAKMALANDNTKFVTKVLGELNEAQSKISFAGFEPKKVFVGVGASYKQKFFGLWKYSAGFIGWIGFVPVKVSNLKSLKLASIPAKLMNEEFQIGGGEEESNKTWWPFRRRTIARTSFQSGLQKSLKTAAYFAEQAQTQRSAHWTLAEIKTTNEISYTGFFGIADLTTRGNLEIDFKRK